GKSCSTETDCSQRCLFILQCGLPPFCGHLCPVEKDLATDRRIGSGELRAHFADGVHHRFLSRRKCLVVQSSLPVIQCSCVLLCLAEFVCHHQRQHSLLCLFRR